MGAGTALFVAGTCSGADAPLRLVVDGSEQPLMAYGMPRLDLFRAGGSYRAGFWGLATIGPRRAGTSVTIAVRAGRHEAELARIAIIDPPAPPPGAPLVAICMAAFEPPIELFRRQIESIRAQTRDDWICIVSDDCSSPARLAEMETVLGDDPRFVLSRSDRRRGFYGNFERALSLAPADARYIAPADQDDVWDPDKLATLVGAIGDARLVYSDARVIARDGRVLAETYWSLRRPNHTKLLSLLVANWISRQASTK